MSTRFFTGLRDERARRLLAQCEVSTFRVRGPGGQHRNRRESGVRLLHVPTGQVVVATERRSQYINKLVALERLAARLAARNRKKKPRVPTAPPGSARERRLEEKARRARAKSLRRKVAVPVEE